MARWALLFTKHSLLLGLLLACAPKAHAQKVNSKGTDFWVGFMDAYTLGRQNLTLTLFVSSEQAASGTISFPANTGIAPINFTVPAGQVIQQVLDLNPTVSDAYAYQAMAKGSGTTENKGVFVHTDKPVTVYALSYVQFSSDATVVLPLPSLGTDYYAFCVPGTGSNNGSSAPVSRRASELLVVATQDATGITITPSAATYDGKAANVPITVTLNKGQTYQLQANGDLTGSHIQAAGGSECKPFAAFSGNVYQAVCPSLGIFGNDAGGLCSSGNHLYEQLLPVPTWGKTYLTVPYKTRTSDYVRVVASRPSTQVYVDNVLKATLNAGQFYAYLTGQASLVTATAPVGVAQYSQTGSVDGADADPFMICVAPVEQSLTSVTYPAFQSVISPITYYTNIITKTANKALLTYDGGAVSGWQTVPANPAYSYVQLVVPQAQHTLKSDSGFVAYTYLYGQFEAYGYSVGTGLTTLDLNITYTVSGPPCPGKPITFTALTTIPTASFNWAFSDGATASGNPVTHTFVRPGKVTIQVTANRTASCKIDTAKVPLNLGPQVAYIFSNKDTSVCQGTPFTHINVGVAKAYNWTPNVEISNPTSRYPTFAPTASRAYVLQATDAQGCIYYDTINFKVIPQLRINLPKADTVVCTHVPINFTASRPVDWTLDAGTGPTPVGTHSPTLSLNFATAGNYVLKATDVCFAVRNVRAVDKPTITMPSAASLQLCMGDKLPLASDVVSDWYLVQGATITLLATQTRQPPIQTFTTPGTYQVQAQACGKTAIVDVKVNVHPYFLPHLRDTTFCVGSSWKLKTQQPSSWYYQSPAGVTTLLGTGLTEVDDIAIQAGRNNIIADNGGCRDTFTVVGVLMQPAILTPASPITSCQGQLVTFTGREVGYWYRQVGATRTLLDSITNTVTVNFPNPGTETIILNNCGLDAAVVVTIQASPHISIPATPSLTLCGGVATTFATADLAGTWRLLGPTGTQVLAAAPTKTLNNIVFHTAGNYQLIVTAADLCTDTVAITVNPQPTILLTRAVPPQCFGDANGVLSVSLSNGTPPYHLNWNNGDTTLTTLRATAGPFRLIVTDVLGCKDTLRGTLPGPALLQVTNVATTNTTCANHPNGSVTLTVTGGTPPYSYNGGGSPSFTHLPGGLYNYTVVDAHGCSAFASATLSSPPLIVLTLSTTPDSCGQKPGTAQVSATGGTPPFTYLWQSNPPQSTNLATRLFAGNYALRVVDGLNCTVDTSVTVPLLPAPVLHAVGDPAAPDTLILGDAVVRFKAQVSRGKLFYWGFGDHTPPSTQQNPIHTYQHLGTYTARLTLTDSLGCVVQDSAGPYLVVTQPPLLVPNVITPNGDGINDVMQLTTELVQNLKLYVYDRWGRLLFSTNSIHHPWDGTAGGTPVEAGTYFYELELTYTSGLLVRRAGNITLLR